MRIYLDFLEAHIFIKKKKKKKLLVGIILAKSLQMWVCSRRKQWKLFWNPAQSHQGHKVCLLLGWLHWCFKCQMLVFRVAWAYEIWCFDNISAMKDFVRSKFGTGREVSCNAAVDVHNKYTDIHPVAYWYRKFKQTYFGKSKYTRASKHEHTGSTCTDFRSSKWCMMCWLFHNFTSSEI